MPRRTADDDLANRTGPAARDERDRPGGVRDGLDDFEQQGRLAAPRVAVREDEVAVVRFQVRGPGDAGARVALPGHAPAGRDAEHA